MTQLVSLYDPKITSPAVTVQYTGADNNNLVSVSIQIPYKPKFMFWGDNLSVNVYAQAPYLYPGDTVEEEEEEEDPSVG